MPAASVLGRCHGPASCASVDDRRCPQVRAAPPRPRSLGPKDYWRTTAGPRLTTGRAPAACRQTSQPKSEPARSSRSPAESCPGARCCGHRLRLPPISSGSCHGVIPQCSDGCSGDVCCSLATSGRMVDLRPSHSSGRFRTTGLLRLRRVGGRVGRRPIPKRHAVPFRRPAAGGIFGRLRGGVDGGEDGPPRAQGTLCRHVPVALPGAHLGHRSL